MPTDRPGGSSDRDRVPVYILAGGRSRRFGSNKARFRVDGEALIASIARTVAPCASSVTVVAARDGEYDDLGLRTIGDSVAGKGPLGGLLTAIDDLGDGWLLLLACDWVGIDASWIDVLMGERTESADAVSYFTDRFEPLFALYHTRIRSTVERHLREGTFSMQALLAAAPVIQAELPTGWERASNQNSPPRGKK